MKATVVKRVSFSAAHSLPNYVGKCRNLHGHNWIIDIGVIGEVNSKSGMVIDFGELKGVLQPILDNLDHRLINNIIPNPTAENIALYILTWLTSNWELGNMVEFIRVWETDDSYVEVRRG